MLLESPPSSPRSSRSTSLSSSSSLSHLSIRTSSLLNSSPPSQKDFSRPSSACSGGSILSNKSLERKAKIKSFLALSRSQNLMIDMAKVNISTITTSHVKEINEFVPSIFCRIIQFKNQDKDEDRSVGAGSSSSRKFLNQTLDLDSVFIDEVEFPELSKKEKTEGYKVIHCYPPEVSLKEVSCGLSHYIFLFSNGTVFVLGKNYHGEIGLGYEIESVDGHNAKKLVFFDVEKKRACLEVSCGASHTIFFCEDGYYYGCGSNQFGQLNSYVKTSEDWISPNSCLFEPTKLLIGGYGTIVRSLGEYATIEFQNYQTRVCGANFNGTIGPKSRKIIEEMKELVDSAMLDEIHKQKSISMALRRKEVVFVAATATQTWFAVDRTEMAVNYCLEIGKIENGVMNYIFTFDDPDHMIGIHCTQYYPLIHCYDRKSKCEGIIVPLDVAKFMGSTPSRTIPTSKCKLVFVPFTNFINTESEIERVEASPYNGNVVFYEKGGKSAWLLDDSFDITRMDATTLVGGECYEMSMHLRCSQDRILFYLKN